MKHETQFEIDRTYIVPVTDSPVTLWLIRARARLNAGWCQGTLNDEHGNVCAVGALYMTAKDYTLRMSQPYDYLMMAMDECILRFSRVQDLNDSYATTKADVLTLYDRAIELSRTGGGR